MVVPFLAAAGGAALGQTLGGGLASLFQKNPSDSASPYLNQIPGELHKAYDPYINRGNSAYDVMNPQLTSMAQDPAKFLEMLQKNYQPSKSYQLRKDEALQSAANTAAAGGVRGNLNDIKNQARITDSLLGEDMQQWLNNVLGIQGQGLQGQQHLYDIGYGASSNLGGDLSNVLGTQGQNAYQGQQYKNQRLANMFQMFGGLGGGALGGAFGGGAGGGGGSLGNQFMTSSNPYGNNNFAQTRFS